MSATAAPPEPAPAPAVSAAQHSRSRSCPLAAAEDALWLLDRGRAGMAWRVLETLPELLLRAERERLEVERTELNARIASLEDSLAQRRALLGHVERLGRELADVRAILGAARKAAAKGSVDRTRPLSKPHARLAAALANGTVTAERVAELLKLNPRHVYELAAGRVGLASSSWRRVRPLLETEAT